MPTRNVCASRAMYRSARIAVYARVGELLNSGGQGASATCFFGRRGPERSLRETATSPSGSPWGELRAR
eukprot:710747-Pleurochrysis_carterae.AAC.1